MASANDTGSAQAAPATKLYTPEQCLSIPPGGIPINLVNCCLDRAEATIRLVMAAGDDGEFSLNHADIIGALWAASGWLEMGKKALNREGAA